MKPTGQRQDVAFLALTVAVLAIGVAIFVGVRALPGLRARRQPAPAPAAPAPPPETPKLPGSGRHDPFAGKPAQKPVPAGKSGKPGLELKLVGIVRGRQPLAVIRRGAKRYYARQGDQVAGYVLAEIGEGRALLTKGSERMTLLLRARESEEGGEGEAESGSSG